MPGKVFTGSILVLTAYTPAGAYHQEYFEHNGGQPCCRVVIAPKLAEFRKKYVSRLKA